MKTESFITTPRNSLRGWYHTQEEIQDAIENKKILNPMLDLTNACNLNCAYCYIEEKNSSRKQRRPNELSLEETIRIIDTFYLLGAKTIDLVGAGEPTIDPHFEEIVQHIHSLGMVTTLFTNGIKVAHDNSRIFTRFLYDKNVTVVLKWNSIDKYRQDLVAGRTGYYDAIQDALINLHTIGFAKDVIPTRLGINTIAYKGNLAELPELHGWCRKNNMFPMTGEFIPTGRTEAGEFVADAAIKNLPMIEQDIIKKLLVPLDEQDRKWLRMKITEIDKEFGVVHSDCPSYYGGSICTQQIGLYVDIEGNIWPCVARGIMHKGVMQSGLLGNVRNGDSIEKIWNTHSYFEKIRTNFNGSCPYKDAL